MSDLNAYIADGIFTGEEWLPSYAVLTRGGGIAGLVEATELPSSARVIRYDNAIIAPAFIDVQIYGASKRLFSAYPDKKSLTALADHNRRGGTYLCLPTIATNTKDICLQAIDAIREYWLDGGKGVYGLHLEGPWLNPVRRGAHVESFIHAPSMDEVKELLDYGEGVIRMVTLAPEVCDELIVSYIRSRGVIVSAGHSNATYLEATDAFDKGISTVTHLFNAMSPLHHRATGRTGATLDHNSVMASIIPDGIHVDFSAVSIAKKIMKERLFVITDAVTDADTGPYQHVAAGNKFEAGGILSGSALRMNDAVRNLVEHVQVSMEEALRMCSLYPAKAIGRESRAGRLQEGYDAAMVVLDKQFAVVELIDFTD